MKIEAFSGDLSKQRVDAVVVGLFGGTRRLSGVAAEVNRATGGVIADLISRGEIRGDRGEITVIHTVGRAYPGFAPARVIVAGLGDRDTFDLDRVRALSGEAARRMASIGVRSAITTVFGGTRPAHRPEQTAEALTEGALLGLYRFDRYRSKGTDRGVPEVLRILVGRADLPATRHGIRTGEVVSAAAALARDWVNEPANIMTPTALAGAAREAAQRVPGVECEVFDRAYARSKGMGAYLGVAQGSQQPPRIIVMRYRGDSRRPRNNIWLVGKGITFDSGGLSLKPTDGMTTMKGDMAGGAAVIAALTAIATLKPRLNVTALVLATENMPSGSAQRVSDVVRSMSGKYIEVANTDAEGRLTLADALEYARQNGAERIVDVATLTGAAVIGLGHGNSAAFSNDDRLVEQVIQAGKQRGEPIWRLPLDEVARKQNDSRIADIKNTGGRAAGSITGAHFIGEFAGKTPWVHLDIAGTFMADSPAGWTVSGATGVMARTLTQLALDLSR